MLAAGLLAGCGGDSDDDQAGSANPFAEKAQFDEATPRLEAAAKQATADGDQATADLLTRLDEVPTGIWLTPERYPTGSVGPFVSGVVQRAAGQTVPLFVVYGIPDRDCSGAFSAGGLTPETYLPWVQEIAAAAGDQSAVVVEPDALPGVLACDTGGEEADQVRLDVMKGAVGAFADAGTTTYVDAGHSDWIEPEQMAPLLQQVGVDGVRGFSTNVANYQPQANEISFARRLSDLLGGAHYVIDTGRNGDPDGTTTPVSDWCNPSGRALGTEPGFVDDGTPLDAVLWIKPPAESDGTCHGGPTAGEVWIDRALALAEAAGW
ncbi:hypothetical protein GCM10023340_17020 [Nocardioides marinquilinus]|uniref:Glucanase n=1 Tax=Nocardioides marinquilinus TaxID=1210400 RepID=A0ABP9PGP8_9ACTN